VCSLTCENPDRKCPRRKRLKKSVEGKSPRVSRGGSGGSPAWTSKASRLGRPQKFNRKGGETRCIHLYWLARSKKVKSESGTRQKREGLPSTRRKEKRSYRNNAIRKGWTRVGRRPNEGKRKSKLYAKLGINNSSKEIPFYAKTRSRGGNEVSILTR